MRNRTARGIIDAPAPSTPRLTGRVQMEHASERGSWIRRRSTMAEVSYYFVWTKSPQLNRHIADGAEVSFTLQMDSAGRPIAVGVEALDTLPVIRRKHGE